MQISACELLMNFYFVFRARAQGFSHSPRWRPLLPLQFALASTVRQFGPRGEIAGAVQCQAQHLQTSNPEVQSISAARERDCTSVLAEIFSLIFLLL
jgi:hypothetical protein